MTYKERIKRLERAAERQQAPARAREAVYFVPSWALPNVAQDERPSVYFIMRRPGQSAKGNA